MTTQGKAFSEYFQTYCSLINLGNKSDGDNVVNIKAKINSAIIGVLLRFG